MYVINRNEKVVIYNLSSSYTNVYVYKCVQNIAVWLKIEKCLLLNATKGGRRKVHEYCICKSTKMLWIFNLMQLRLDKILRRFLRGKGGNTICKILATCCLLVVGNRNLIW